MDQIVGLTPGMLQNETSNWSILVPVLDQMISDGSLQRVIVVGPNGAAGSYGGSMWTNSVLYGRFEDYVVQDVVGYVDQHYLTILNGDRRALLGFSMGAIGTMTIGLTHTDVFGSLAAHSGYYNWDRIREDFRTQVLRENPGPPYHFHPAAGTYTKALFMVGGGYSPDLPNFPYQVDFPLDMDGAVVESVLDTWKLHNPAVLAAALPPGQYPHIYFDVGTSDQFFMYPTNVDLDASLTALGIPHEYHSYAGSHNLYPARLEISLAFLNAAFNAASSVGNSLVDGDGGIQLLPSQPNPVHDRATLRFHLPVWEDASLRIIDVRGRSVGIVAEGQMSAGDHTVIWDAERLPAGVYFCELRAGAARTAQRLVVTHD